MMTDEEKIIGGVKVGVDVDIKRSNGRIHSAVVSGVNLKTLSVTVEWFERGETKGKEIELDQILELNQDLAPITESISAPVSKLPKSFARPSIPAAPSQTVQAGNNKVSRRNPARQSPVLYLNFLTADYLVL